MRSFIREFWLFGLKQAYACIFGGFLLAVMVVTRYWYPFDSLHRYDFIFLAAVTFQLLLLVFRLETLRESLVIVVFHVVATVMELFKTSDAIGSWRYPEQFIFGIATVPLFTGFMYSAVGSYIARIWCIFHLQYADYPSKSYTFVLVVLIYLNFFSHHFIWDLRWPLLVLTAVMFRKTKIYFRVRRTHRNMPLLLGWLLVALFIWFAENIATFTNVWIYPNQAHEWHLVSISKLVAWFLLMLISFVLVSLINDIKVHHRTEQKAPVLVGE